MTDKVQKIKEWIQIRKLYTMDEHMKFYCKEAESDYNLLCSIEKVLDSQQEVPVSEDLEKAIDTYLATYWGGEQEKQNWPYLKKMAIHFANWQKQKNESKVLTEEQCRKIRDDAFELGKDAMKQQMLAKAVDAVVKIDAGGYPYVDATIELYDYLQDIPLAKEGDKYNVILIKED